MRIDHIGDTMLLVGFDRVIDPAVNQRVIELADRLQQRLGDSVRDVVPGYCTLGIHFDPLVTDLRRLEDTIRIEAALAAATPRPEAGPSPPIEIPVRYGGEDGPDLEAVAEWATCAAADVITIHATRVYRVFMLGFVPGFAYLGSVDTRIAAPRRDTPRQRVPAGSVGIAGEQTGVYPISTPGGWQLIGRTDTRMFDPLRSPPSLLKPGDAVRFVPAATAR